MGYEDPAGADAGSPSPRVPVSALSADEADEHKGKDDEDRSDLERGITDENPVRADAGSLSPRFPVSALS